jgi:hypothetical protein
MSQPFYPWQRELAAIVHETVWAQAGMDKCRKYHPQGNSIPGLSDRPNMTFLHNFYVYTMTPHQNL